MPGDTGFHAAVPRRTAGSMLKTAAAIWLSTRLALLLPLSLPAQSPAATAPAPPPWSAPAALTADMPPQPLAVALKDFARQTGLQYASVDGVVSSQQTQGAPAGLPATEALARLLEGTGLRFQLLNERIVLIVAISPGAGADEPLPSLQEVLILAHRIAKPYLPQASAKEQRALEGTNAELEERIASEHLLYGHAELDHYLQAVAERLLAVDETDPSSVHVRVIKGVDANAFALSNGSIYLTTALLATLDDEAQLAAVLGHELTHYINRHALRVLREERDARIVSVTTDAVIDAALILILAHQHNGPGTSPWIRPENPEIWVRAAISGYSRDLEREADDGGIRRMIAAGYDPVDALTALEHLAQQTTAKPVGETPLYASHPRIDQRMASYRDLLASRLAAAAGVGDRRGAEYRTQLAQLPLDQVELLIEASAPERAERLLAAEIATADSGRAEFLKGELSRKRVPQTDATVQTALLAYERAVTLGEAPVSAYRQAGLLHRLRGEPEAAAVAFQTYLERAPTAVDAPLVRIYLEEIRTSSPEVKR